MARQLNGTNQDLQFSAGNIAGVHAFGSVGALFKRDGVGGTSWRCPVYSGQNTGTSNWGLSLDINTGNTMWAGVGTGQATGSFSLNSTTLWYLVIWVKPTGTVASRFHYRTFDGTTWSAWTHEAGDSMANATIPTVNGARIGSFGGADFFNGSIAAVFIADEWAPDDAAIEAINWHTGAADWKSALQANAATSSALWVPGSATSGAITDAMGGGADQTNAFTGTQVAGPAGWNESTSGGGTVYTDDVTTSLVIASDLSTLAILTEDVQAAVAIPTSISDIGTLAESLDTTLSGTTDLSDVGSLTNTVDTSAVYTSEVSDSAIRNEDLEITSSFLTELLNSISWTDELPTLVNVVTEAADSNVSSADVTTTATFATEQADSVLVTVTLDASLAGTTEGVDALTGSEDVTTTWTGTASLSDIQVMVEDVLTAVLFDTSVNLGANEYTDDLLVTVSVASEVALSSLLAEDITTGLTATSAVLDALAAGEDLTVTLVTETLLSNEQTMQEIVDTITSIVATLTDSLTAPVTVDTPHGPFEPGPSRVSISFETQPVSKPFEVR